MKQRPIRRNDPRRINPYRIPEEGPLTPRLRQKASDISAVGFHHDFSEKEDDE